MRSQDPLALGVSHGSGHVQRRLALAVLLVYVRASRQQRRHTAVLPPLDGLVQWDLAPKQTFSAGASRDEGVQTWHMAVVDGSEKPG